MAGLVELLKCNTRMLDVFHWGFRVGINQTVDLLTNHVDLSCRKPLITVASVQSRSQEKHDLYVGRLFPKTLTFKCAQLCRRDLRNHTTRNVKGTKETSLRMCLRTVSVLCSIGTSGLFCKISLRLFSQNLLGKCHSIVSWLMMHLINSPTRTSLHTLESTLLITSPAADVLCH